METEDRLEDVAGQLRAQVVGRVGVTDPKVDDLSQEALIEFWRVREGTPGYGTGYYKRAARHRVTEVLTGRLQPLGSEPGGKGQVHFRPQTVAVDWAESEFVAPPVGDVIDQVLHAEQHSEVLHALASLSPEDRVLVIERFWGGKTWPEIEREQGLRYQAASGRWQSRIKPRLREALGHLAVA